MKKNGVTIIELIVSVSLISIVLIFLFRLLVTLKDLDDKSLSKLEYEEKVSLIIDNVQDTIKDLKGCKATVTKEITINCEGMISDDRNIVLNYNGRKFTVSNKIGNSAAKAKTYTFPSDSEIKGGTVTNIEDGNQNSFLIQYKVIDDKDNVYPIEISYYSETE